MDTARRAIRMPNMRTKILVLLVAAAVLALPAAAPPSVGAEPHNQMEITWDGEETRLDWTGREGAVATGSFLGEQVVFPSDRVTRSAVITNAGPSVAAVRVELRDVAVVTPPEAVNIDLQDCIHLFIETDGKKYAATWREASEAGIDGTSWSTTFDVPADASFTILAGAYFPSDETRGRSEGRPSQQLSFIVRVTLTGEVAATPSPQIRTGGWATPSN